MRRRWLALAVIVTVLSGCDNVAWGGVEVQMQAPPSQADLTGESGEEQALGADEADGLPSLPEGPILLTGLRDGPMATLVAVGEIRGSQILPFPSEDEEPGFRERLTSELLGPGSEFVLFSEGARVGRLAADSTGVDDRYCVPRTTVTGRLELVPGAVEASHFLAISASGARDREYGAFQELEHTYEQRVASLDLASAAIPAVGAQWPTSVLEARRDIQTFRLPEADAPTIATTFLFRDQLAVEEAPEGAWSMFMLGSERGDGSWARDFTWYRPADDDGKGAPRFVDHLDVDGNGSSEILLEVLGDDSRWFAGLTRGGGEWRRTYQDPCGAEVAAADTASAGG